MSGRPGKGPDPTGRMEGCVDLMQVLVLGLVEGFTEFLPISSAGHLIVVGAWLGLGQNETQTAFDIIIQLAAILAVVANYRDKFALAHIVLWQKIVLAFLPIGVVGFLLAHTIEKLFSVEIVATAFIVGGVVFLVVEYFYRQERSQVTRAEDVTWKQAFWIGIAQVFALIPGTSRAGSTIIGALLVGMDRKASTEFSFLLALPVMCATTGYEFLKHYRSFTETSLVTLAAGFVTVFIVAYFTMRWFLRFLDRFTFVSFGIYRILFGLVLFIWFL